MEQESKEGRENGGKSDTKDTKEEEITQTADKEVAECGVERDTGNGVAPIVDDDIETDSCQGPEAKPGKGNTTEEPSKKVQSDNDSAQPTVESQLPENASGVETKAEVKEPYDEAQNATEDKNIAQGKADQTKASNSEEQSDPDSSQADSGTDQVETSRTVQDQDGGPPQTAADSPSELAGNKEIKEPNDKTIDAPTAQNITRDKMDGSTSNGTQEASPGSGGIPDSNLEKLAKALPGEEYRNARSLGQNLGFIPTEVYQYCGYGKPKDSTRILRMLRAWKDRTPDEKQISGLLEALKKANLKHLASDLRSQEGAEEQREAVQTSDGDSVTSPSKSVQPTTTRSDPLTDNPKSSPSVEPVAGPGTATKGAPGNYSRQTDREEKGAPQKTDSSSKPKGTNSKKVLPGAGLDPYAERATRERSGKSDKEKEREPQTTGSSSKPKETKPPKVPCNPPPNQTTPNSGSKDPKDEEGARERKTKELSEEEKRATENKANELKLSKEGAAAAGNGTKEDGTPKQKAKEEGVEAGGTDLPAKDVEESFEDVSKERPVSISVCTSAYDFNVQGLVSFLKDIMKDQPELIKEVKFHALPYNDLDHYTFPKDHPVDVMLLCHSINNRRFAITDVMDALYDEYLPYCARVVGKDKMGVIVHDFEDMRETVQASRMGSFSYKQPKAFETTSLQIICGHIEKKEQVLNQMQKADREKVLEFLKNASRFPEQMMENVNANPGLLTFSKEKYYKYKAQLSSYISSSLESNTQQGCTQDESSVDPVEAEVKDACRHLSADDSQKISGSQTTKRFGNEHSCQKTKRLYVPGTPGVFYQTPQASMDERNLNPLIGQQRPGTSNIAALAHTRGSPRQQPMASGRTVTSAPQRSHTTSSPRRISISVCSSAYENNVKGFISKLTELQTAQTHMIADVRFRSLPYNDIDSFRFLSNDPVDVMVLCHSVQNRGFSITNVLNALYEKHLQYCHDVIGKKKLAVIVHDFSDCKPKILDARMESFRRSQPLTFELVNTVIVCGSLEKPGKIEMRDEDMTELIIFLERARFEPKENYADDKSSWKSWFSRKNSNDK